MAMDAKDLRTDSALSAPNDEHPSYNQSSTALQTNRNKPYQDIGSNSLGKVESQATRPCAIIGPDRVLPPHANDVYLKKAAVDPWPCNENVYRHQSDFTQKLPEFQQVRNISPRQTFQENMQRIMVPPSYNSTKNIEDPNLKNSKGDMPLEHKYCDVPYSMSPVISGQKSIRNSDIPMTSVNPAFARVVPPHGWPTGVSARPLRPYGAPEFYQYPDLSNFTSTRPMPRPNRTATDDSPQAERLYHDGNMRFKPYPMLKERYPQFRYDYANNYPNTFHPPAPFPLQKYDLSKSVQPQHYPMYPQVPMRRVGEPILDSYQRSNQPTNFNPYHNQYIPPPYGPVPGNCIQNKLYSHPSEISAKSLVNNKLPYDITNKMNLEYENNRNKMCPVDNMYYADINRQSASKNTLPIHPGHNMQYNMLPQYNLYRKDNIPMKTFDSMNYRNIDQNVHVNSPLLRQPLQFSPSGLVISPVDTSASADTIQTLNAIQEDCGYVSQSSTTSGRSIDLGNYRMQNEIYRRHDNFYSSNIKKFSKQMSNSDSLSNSSDKKGLNVRQFLQMWNEGEEEVNEGNNAPKNVNKCPSNSETISNQEQLYVLGLVNIPNEELCKYEHIQKISKLPENIKGYNSIELLDQYEQLVESPALRHGKTTTLRDYQISPKAVAKLSPQLPRPVSPLDVEAKISQSVIHKEVGCNFEIKPCSPEMLNVELATPIQNVLDERAIEKVINLGIGDSSVLSHRTENTTSCNMNSPFISNKDSIKSSNYSFQDLESNSGICLASLPRLDSDIELNFPEINQQFIDANKINTNSVSANSVSDTVYVNNLHKHEASEFIGDRKTPKLSKYRKNKTYDFLSGDNGHCAAMNRTDSVIIKNPDNIRKQEEIVTNMTIKENKGNDNIILSTAGNEITHNISELSKNFEIEELGNTAIDFSLKVNERQNYSPERQNLLVSLNSEPDPQKLNICGSNNGIESEVMLGVEELKKDNLAICKTKCNTEISLSLPSCEDISLESICDEESNANFLLTNNKDTNQEESHNEDGISITHDTAHSNVQMKGIYANDKDNIKSIHLPLLGEGETELNNHIITVSLNKEKAEDKGFVTVDNSTENFVKDTELSMNDLLLNNKNKLENRKKSMSAINEELTQPSSDCNFYHSLSNDTDAIKHEELSDIDNDDKNKCKNNQILNKDSVIDQLLNTQETRSEFAENEDMFQNTGDEKGNTCKTENITISNSQEKKLESEIHLDLGESYKTSLNNSLVVKEIHVDDSNNDCTNKKNICKQNSIIEEQDVNEKNLLSIGNNQSLESQNFIKLQNINVEQVNPKGQEIEKIQSNLNISVEPISMKIDSIRLETSVENSNNNTNEINIECHSNTLKQEENQPDPNNIIDNQINCEDQYKTHSEFSKTQENGTRAKENERHEQSSHIVHHETESTAICPDTLINLCPVDKKENQTSFDISQDIPEINYNKTQSNIFEKNEIKDLNVNSPKTNEIAQNVKQMSDIETTEDKEENFHSIKIPEIDKASKLSDTSPFENEKNHHSLHKEVSIEFNKWTTGILHRRKPKYFRKKYFSPCIQNLLIYSEGNCEIIVKGRDVIDNKKIGTLSPEDLLSETNNHITDENVNEDLRTTKNVNNMEILQTSSLESDSCINRIYNNHVPIKNDFISSEKESNCSIVNFNEIMDVDCSGDKNKDIEFSTRRITMKRSLSDSALGSYNNNPTKEQGFREHKRRKLIPDEILDRYENEDLSSIIQNNRRNSISAIGNNPNVYILIDNNDEYIFAQDEHSSSKICFTEVSDAFCNPSNAILNLCLPNETEESPFTENFVTDNLELENDIVSETWVEDIACVETVFNDDVAEDITISAPISPENLSGYGNHDEDSTCSDSEINDNKKIEHIVRIKEICGDNLCLDDVQLYQTPQMNVNKTLADIESQNIHDSTDIVEDFPNINVTKNSEYRDKSHVKSEMCLINDEIEELDEKAMKIHKNPLQFAYNFPNIVQNYLENTKCVKDRENGNYIVDSCDLSTDEYISSENKDNDFHNSASSSPEVSSTTSEERGSSILLKITSLNGSRRSQINNIPEISNRGYNLTEFKNYTTNYRPLITKAAKKYIPPLIDSRDLKVKLPLPQQSLYKLKQLKMAKRELLAQKSKHVVSTKSRDVPRKTKPKFEDVLKSIDEIQFKMQREKNKKAKHSIPKVVIKKNENGAHYASSSNKKKSYNPDLTGRKWQPWVFIERNEMVDKMAQRNKVKAVYCHRKKTYVLADKFKKYKSICTANFVITQPTSDNVSSGNLKYTIRLKHNY